MTGAGKGAEALKALEELSLLSVRPYAVDTGVRDVPLGAYGKGRVKSDVVMAPSPAHFHAMGLMREELREAVKKEKAGLSKWLYLPGL